MQSVRLHSSRRETELPIATLRLWQAIDCWPRSGAVVCELGKQ